MAAFRWISVGIMAGLAIALSTRAVQAASPTPAGDIDQLNTTITSAGTSQAQRDEAARRLVSRGAPAARELARKILSTGGVDSELAVARALGEDPHPDPQFIATLAQLLGSERLHEAASRALARYTDSDVARDRLTAFARDVRQVTRLRVITIRSLAPMVDKRVAATLIELLSDPRQGAAIQNAAADALVEMTGLSDNGRDVQRWKQWSAANSSRSDSDWKATIFTTRSARLEDIAQRYSRLQTELDSILTERYQQAPERDKSDVLMRYLNSAEPEVRGIGTRIALTNFNNGQENPEKVMNRLKELVGDSDVRVRLETARALKSINYPPALDALLVQLAQEQDPEVKIALIGAISRNGDLKALPLLRKSLHDSSLRVATAAAEGFVPRGGAAGKALGQVLYDADKTLAHEVAEEIWSTAESRANEAGSADFRAACLEAVAPLRDSALVIPMTRLLTPDQPERTRAAALHVLGELGDPNSEDAIRGWLVQENDPAVRLDALDALGKTGSFALDAEALYSFFSPRTNEPDRAVQDKAWQVFGSLLPTASKQLLSTWQNKLSHEPKHQLPVLLELDRKLLKDRDLESLAETQQTTGDTYLKLGQPDKAATYFQNALSYWQSQHEENATTEGLVHSLMIALLKSEQYDKAAQFAADSIAASRAQQSTFGPLIRDEVGQLIQAADNASGSDSIPLKNAARLVDEAMKMKPALDDQYLDDIKRSQKEIKDLQSRLKGKSPGS